jgi:hypothetical protein
MLRSLVPLSCSLLLLACGGAAVAPAKAPEAAPEPTTAVVVEPSSSRAKAAGLGEKPPGLPEPPAECAALVGEAPSTCAAGNTKELLAAALVSAPEARDVALRCLEKASDLPPGFVRALRADLAPRACGDVVVGEWAGAPSVARELADALVALGVGARLNRSVRGAPLPKPPFTKAEFFEHFKKTLRPWIVEQAHAVDVLSQVGPRLSGYGKAVVALEAGLADMRFVTVARSIDLPAEMKADPEVRETYLVALEQALEPRVARGRDAALVGLGELSRQGVTRDERLREARRLLSELYAGRRIDALDGLLLAPLAPLTQDGAAYQLAAKLPAFYSLRLDTTPNIDDPKLLRARLEQGVPPWLWLTRPAPSSPELAALEARALFQLGQVYFWSEPFTKAAGIETAKDDADAALVAALAKVLARGPRNAAALMLGPTTLPAELRDTSALDALSKGKASSPVAGLAEFDAAYVRGLAPPAEDPAFWKDQRARFERAQKKLTDQAAKAKAGDLAKAAMQTEQELRKHPKP